MDLVFRSATADDRHKLLELQRAASLTNPEDRAFLLANPGIIDTPASYFTPQTAVVALAGSEIVGFAIVLDSGDGAAELDGLFVLPELFRRGIGRALLGEAVRLARAMRATRLHVVANPNAAAFYRAVGFVEVGMVETEFGSARTMELDLLVG